MAFKNIVIFIAEVRFFKAANHK